MIDKIIHHRANFLILVAVLGIVSLLQLKANLDFSDGRYLLHMDELITFDEIEKTIAAKHPTDFINTIIGGDEFRYGRILWNVNSLIAYLPNHFYGSKGIIISQRLTQALLLSVSYCLLVFGFVKLPLLRFLTIALLLLLPGTIYYSTMPKPEPIQLFFITMFLLIIRKKGIQFGWWWVFLGLAFGSKISVLFLVFYFGVLGLLSLTKSDRSAITRAENNWFRAYLLVPIGLALSFIIFKTEISQNFDAFIHGDTIDKLPSEAKSIVSTVLYDLIHQSYWLWASGLLFFSTLVSGILFILSRKARLKAFIVHIYNALMFFVTGLTLSIPAIAMGSFLFNINHLGRYVQQTFLSTGHNDNIHIGISDWLHYVVGPFSTVPIFLSVCIIISLGILVGYYIFTCVDKTSVFRFITDRGLILLSTSAFLILPILFLVKRLWGFYLHLGLVILVLATAYMIEALLLRMKAFSSPVYKWLMVSLLASFIVTSTCLFNQSLTSYHNLAHRSKSEQHTEKLDRHLKLKAFLTDLHDTLGRKVEVYISPNFYNIRSNEAYEINNYWGYFNDWSSNKDVILSDRDLVHAKLPASNMTSFESSKRAQLQARRAIFDLKTYTPLSTPWIAQDSGLFVYRKRENQ